MERSKIGLVLAKIESVYGSDPTPTAAANAIAVVNGSVNFAPEMEPNDRELLDQASVATLAGVPGLVRAKLGFRVELRGNRTNGTAADISSGSATNALRLSPLLRACDLAETYTPEASSGSRDGYVTYAPTVPSDQGASCTLYFYSGLKLHKLTGCKGTLKGVAEAGKMAYLDFEFQGLYNAPTDVAISSVSNLAYEGTMPPLCAGNTFSLGAYSAAIARKLDFDLGNNVIMRPDMLSADGVKGFMVGSRGGSGSLSLESVAEATHPVFADLKAGTVKTLTYLVGGSAGNKIQLTCTLKQRSVAYEDAEGNRNLSIGFDIRRSDLGADTTFALKFF